MSFLSVTQSLIALVRLVSTALVTGLVIAPMSWSPDGDWLAYTVTVRPDHDRLAGGWLFDTGGLALAPAATTDAPTADGPARPSFYQIWASERDCRRSALIEQSRWPLSAPAWSSAGHSIAYCRFVPRSDDSSQGLERGRYELVVQESLERKRVVWEIGNFVMDPATRAEVPHLACAWSADGAYVAIPRPGRPAAVVIVRADSGQVACVAEHAMMPAWSPSGELCAVIHEEAGEHSIQVIERGAARWNQRGR